MHFPLISIGLTCYNAAQTIERAVKSALCQNWKNTEIIIVDDASNDETLSILKQIIAEHSAIKVIYQKTNQGVAAARNVIINNAKGEFIVFFDDDDESQLTRLEKQYERIVSYEQEYAKEGFVICHTARTQNYPDGVVRHEATMGTGDGIAPHGESVALRILTGKPVKDVFGSTATCSQMARTATYKMLNGFDESFRRSEDTEFNVRAARQGAHFIGINEALVTQTMTYASDKTLKDENFYMLKLLEKNENFIDRYSSYNFCIKWMAGKNDFLEGRKIIFLFKLCSLLLSNPILTMKRIFWSLPNIGFNIRTRRHHE